jgi:glycosyltransferase involved in cell wall biosynthesis
MIVRDCEKTLVKDLDSIRPYVDELVIVDTGSVDKTVEIAAASADILVGFQWCDDFAKARQHALDLCTGDWCMWLDSDDEVIGGINLRNAIRTAPADLGMYMLRYITATDLNGNPMMEFWRERLFRRGGWHWEGRVHEVLITKERVRYERFAGAHVLHHGHGDGRPSLERNVRLLRKALEDEPTNTRTMFYLGRDLVTCGELDEGRAVLERYVGVATWPDERFIAQNMIGYCHRAQGRYQEAYMADLALLGIQPRWPQAYFALAEDAYYLQRFDWSTHFCEIGQALPAPETNLFVARDALEFDWMIYQVVSLWNTGNQLAAVALTKKALELRPGNPLHQQNALFFAGLIAQQPTAVGA